MIKINKIAEMGFLVSLILALVGMLAIVGVVKQASKTPAYDLALCKQSVAFNSRGRLPGLENQIFPVECPTRYVYFYEDEWKEEVGYAKNSKIEKGNIGADVRRNKEKYLDGVNRKVADLIYECWDQFAAGNTPVFSMWTSDIQCKICSEVVFDEKVRQELSDYDVPEEQDFDNFMRSNSIPERNSGITYYEFALDQVDAFDYPHYSIDFNQDYAIVFRSINQNGMKRVTTKAWDVFKKLAFANPASGKEVEFVNTIDFVPKSEVIRICDTLE